MNKSFCLVLSLLEINKIVIVMYVFWYDYVKPKYGEKVMLRWYSLIIHIKTEEVYKDISNDVETASDYSNYELERALPGGKNWKSYWINEKWNRWKTNNRIFRSN